MEWRSNQRRAAMLGRAASLAAAVLAGGCAPLLGIEELTSQSDAAPGAVDAAPGASDAAPGPAPDAALSGFAVRGSATGVSGPVALELRIDGDTEVLPVTQDGAFAFTTRLEDGDTYAVVLVDPNVPCTLRNQTGVIAGAATAIELTCTGTSLASLVVSGIAPPTVTLELGTSDYVVDLPLLQQSVTLTASVATAGDTLTIAGAPAASGAPSAELTLGLGDNPVDIVLENDIGWRRTYRLTVRRAAQIAQAAYGKASNTDSSDSFGYSVALSGDTLAVGAYREDSAALGVGGNQGSNAATDSGAVYVFRRSGTAWAQEAYLKASNTAANDYFGYSVALSGDTLAVGAYLEDSGALGVGGDQGDAAPASGAVYVFRRSGTAWAQEAYVKASNTERDDEFGYSVALSGDTLAVGARYEASGAEGVGGDQDFDVAEQSGAVYVFRRSGTTWAQEAYVKASNTGPDDYFGTSVALSGDTLAVGAPGEDSGAQGVGGNQEPNTVSSSGAVYVFRRGGTAWAQEAYVKASNTGTSDLFGTSVALSGDTLAVGAWSEDSAALGVGGNQGDDTAANSGAVYVFRRSGTTWAQEAYLKASNTGASDAFGYSVALSGDTLAVGAWNEDSAAPGVGGNQGDNTATDSGAVYVFGRSGTTWTQEAYGKASNTAASDFFGASVALSGDTLAIGATGEDSGALGVGGNQGDNSRAASGAVYVFH